MVLQRHCEMDPAITRAERYVRQDPPRFQAARRGWVGEGNRSVPTGDSPATPTEVRSVERSALVSSLSLDIMASIVRATCSSSPFLSAHNQIIPHTLCFFPVIASSLASVCLPPLHPYLRDSLLLPHFGSLLYLPRISHVDLFSLSSSVVFRPGLCPHLTLRLRLALLLNSIRVPTPSVPRLQDDSVRRQIL